MAAAPAVNVCKNCGVSLAGPYCSNCGQPNKHLDPTLHDLYHELVHEFLHLDGKIASTLKALILKPGALTVEHFRGRRASYIGPVRLYLTASLLFFVIAAYSPARPINIQINGKNADDVPTEVRRNTGPGPIAHLLSKALKDPELANHVFWANMSRVMFFLVPLFALGVRIAYRNRKQRYPAFVYFSLHYHAFVFLAASLVVGSGFSRSPTLKASIGDLVSIWVVAYLFIALRKVFGGSRKETALRMAAALAFYFPCYVVGLAVAAIVALLMM